ncbi:MAG: plasmid mobilization protein [Opitutaceae bacterium]
MLRKSETLSFRLTPEEKDGLRSAASSLSMSISEYVVKCHEAVAKQLGR